MPRDTYIGIDIGGTKIAAGLVRYGDGLPEVLYSVSAPTLASDGGQVVAQRVVSMAEQYLQTAGNQGLEVAGVGISSAGVIGAQGEVVSATDLMPGWGGIPLGDLVREATGMPVAVLNDVHAHAYGEMRWGIGRDYQSALILAVGTGIGGAIFHQGELVLGSHQMAGHLGHLPHPLATGIKCSCGQYGHIESVASGTGLADLYRRVTQREVAGGHVVSELAADGDATAGEVLQQSAQALGEVIGGLCNAFDPQAVIISGSVANSGTAWFTGVRTGFAASVMAGAAATPILKAHLKGEAPLIGAVDYLKKVETV